MATDYESQHGECKILPEAKTIAIHYAQSPLSFVPENPGWYIP